MTNTPTYEKLLSARDELNHEAINSPSETNKIMSNALKLVLSSITSAETAGKSRKDLNETQVQEILKTFVKKCNEAADAFEKNSSDQAQEKAKIERMQANYISILLPPDISEEETIALIDAAIADGAITIPEVMKNLKQSGKQINMREANKLAREHLTSLSKGNE